MTEIQLSIVLIAKNLEWNIARLIESVQANATALEPYEIIYVDSASTDRTVEIACQYPVGVYRLPPENQLTPAAGRFTGFKKAKGKLLLFLDGDQQLWPGWLEKGLRILDANPDVAGVTGVEVFLKPDQKPEDYTGPGPETFDDRYFQVRQTSGPALFRRTVLEELGPYHPFLYSEEEPEMCLRFRSHGYRLLRTYHPIVFHYSDPRKEIPTLFKRRKRNLYLGYGQVLRLHAGKPTLRTYLKERGYIVMPAIGLLLGLALLIVSLVTGVWWLFGAWVLFVAGLYIVDIVRKRSLYKATFSFIQRLVILEGAVRGFFSNLEPPANYPDNAKEIQAAPVLTQKLSL